jgi:hypothetical protein
MYQANMMKDLILLDNASTVNLFCNQELVENAQEREETLRQSTNGGEVVIKITFYYFYSQQEYFEA